MSCFLENVLYILLHAKIDILYVTIRIDIMDGLREIPGREALKLRAEASRSYSS